MKKLTGFAVILWLLLGAWSGAGWYLLRGAGAYRLPTTLGKVFAASWQYTLLAAVLLAVILLAALVVKIRRKKNAPLQAAAAGETGEAPAEEVPAEVPAEEPAQEASISTDVNAMNTFFM